MTQHSMDNIDDENNLTDSVRDSHQADFEMNELNNTDEEMDLLEASMHEDDNDAEFDEIAELRAWTLSKNPTIPHTRLDALLRILRVRLLPNLPLSSKTFLRTASVDYDVQIHEDSSEFVYFGLKKILQMSINPNLHTNNVVNLKINVDGVQLFKSSSKQFWPILCQVHSEKDVYQPFPIAIYCGTHKPQNLEQYLQQFIEEINYLHENGFEVNGQHLQVKLIAFICDRPARAFIKCIKGHGAYWSCERCMVHGERVEGRTVYPVSEGAEKRTDDSFRNQQNLEHHQGVTPLLNIRLKLDMILAFLLDFMHLVCLGVMEKILNYWLYGNITIRLSQTAKCLLTNLLVKLQHQVPQEFQRTTHSFADVKKFKATELKFLLLYSGPIIFKRVLPTNICKHFLLLHAACRILCSERWAVEKRTHAKKYLTLFVTLAEHLYGKASLISNMHNLIHLADDVRYMNCSLSRISAFPFENTLGIIKKFLRSGNKPLAQIVRRNVVTFVKRFKTLLKYFLFSGHIQPRIQILRQSRSNNEGEIIIKRLQYIGVVLTSRVPNNTVLLDNGLLLKIDRIFLSAYENENDIKITGTIFKKVEPLFTYPCNSADLHMWAVSERNTTSGTFPLNKVIQKMITFDISTEIEEKIYTMPFLHM
ncbi:hypothetical protein ALC57_11792 [Trachymyrmex cornetzi]|uniref:Transposase domain-containing protein n=1 Tax=Trachymyrmex cornetzi TaxID=471704 RepID=A0A151J1V4_9HYME|nr:hypothetical protein ALC57_11792 [Trachymyrmex cornetzi]